MSTNVYNIIWADDEFATLRKDTAVRAIFDVYNIEVLKYVPTSEALKDALECYKDKVDAVIVDGNFSKSDADYVDSTDISGLIHTASFIELFNIKRDIPFYLYTAKKMMLQEICKNGEIDYFSKMERIIQKGDMQKLVEKIICDVDHIHSVEFMVKKKYQALIDIIKDIDNQCAENIHQFLLDEARDKNYDKSIDLFGKLRDVLEVVQDLCKKNFIIPKEVRSLNDFKRYWSLDYRTRDWRGFATRGVTYKPNDNLMPKTIAYTLGQLIDITQDGSHKKQDLHLHVSEYTNEAKTPFLFRACLYLVMDVLWWYKDLTNKLINSEIQPQLYTVIEATSV